MAGNVRGVKREPQMKGTASVLRVIAVQRYLNS